jgi:hypothetical protein
MGVSRLTIQPLSAATAAIRRRPRHRHRRTARRGRHLDWLVLDPTPQLRTDLPPTGHYRLGNDIAQPDRWANPDLRRPGDHRRRPDRPPDPPPRAHRGLQQLIAADQTAAQRCRAQRGRSLGVGLDAGRVGLGQRRRLCQQPAQGLARIVDVRDRPRRRADQQPRRTRTAQPGHPPQTLPRHRIPRRRTLRPTRTLDRRDLPPTTTITGRIPRRPAHSAQPRRPAPSLGLTQD